MNHVCRYHGVEKNFYDYGEKCTFIMYKRTKAYKLYNSVTKKNIISRDMILTKKIIREEK